MNIERLTKLRDHLRSLSNTPNPKFGFNMNSFISEESPDLSGHGCDTTCCIGGWAIALFSPDPDPFFCCEEAGEILELTTAQSIALFYLPCNNYSGWDYTPVEAAEAIDRLILGEDPWPVKTKEQEPTP